MVLTDSHRISRVPQYLGLYPSKSNEFQLQAYHLLSGAFPDASSIHWFCNLPIKLYLYPNIPRNPKYTTLTGFNIYLVWALSISLAATLKITIVFFS